MQPSHFMAPNLFDLYVLRGQTQLDSSISPGNCVVKDPVHGMHAVAPAIFDHDPFAHNSHFDSPSAAVNEPTLHVTHFSEPVS
mmetsp:Transcript_85225/g.156300  ORF Transcript_85225/g.156300 Transcript_85225/m.156300 type:complete len:83 (+) Transcript_85225:348-596(+)